MSDPTPVPADTSDGFGDSFGPPIPAPVRDPFTAALTARYRLEDEIGRGGMGAVLRGHDPVLRRDLAVKVLLEEHCDYPELVQRFFEEAQVGGQLQHPGVAPVYDMGRLPDRRPYFAMKLVEGRTLAGLLAGRSGPAQDLPHFLKVFEQVCQTLAYAHARGVIHRDLKPANVMVGAFGEVQVMDWGLAKVLRRKEEPGSLNAPTPPFLLVPSSLDRSQPGTVLGTPPYMPPEQACGRIDQIDARSDVFGLGAVLCEILTGAPPYTGRSGMEVHAKAASGDLVEAWKRLDACGADAPLVLLAKACLMPERDDRPRDGRAVAEAMTAYLAGVQERLHTAEVERATAQARAVEERKRRRVTVALAAAVVALVGLGASAGLWYQRDQEVKRADDIRRQAVQQRLARDKARDVTEALDEAADHLRRAEWADAEAALERASGRLGGDGPDDLFERLRQGRQNLQTVTELENIRLKLMAYRIEKRPDASAPEAFAGKFRADYGVDLQPDNLDESARRILDSPIKDQLVAALESWSGAETERGKQEQLRALLRRADPNPWRDRLWQLADRGDVGGLKRLAAEVKPEEVSTTYPALLASVLLMLDEKDSNAAYDLLRRAQVRRPNDFWVNVHLGTLLYAFRSGAADQAVGYLRVALALRPDNPIVAFELGMVVRQLGGRDEGILLLSQAARDFDFPIGGDALGAALLEDGKTKEAEGAFRAVLARYPNDPIAHVGIGNVLLQGDHWAEAADAFAAAVAADGDNALARYSLGLTRFKMDQTAEAVAALREAVRLQPDYPDAQYYLGLSLMKQANPAEAAGAFRKALERKEGNAEAHYWYGLALMQQGKQADAEEAFRKALAHKADYPEAHCGLGLALLGQGHPSEAADAFRDAVKLKPDDAEAHLGLGLAHLKLDEHAEAADAFRAALKANADYSDAHCGLGRALTALDKPAEALAEFRAAVRLAPDDPGDCYFLALALLQQETAAGAAEAAGLLGKTVAAQPDNADAHFFLGHALYKQERYDKAADAFRKDLRLRDDHAAGHFLLGMSLMYEGRFADAVDALRRADELGSKLPEWNFPSAVMVRTCERLVELDRKLPAILKGDAKPADAGEQAELAEMCLKFKKRYAFAVRSYQEAFASRPALADDLESEHRYDAARAAARAGRGDGDASEADASQRARWRRQALDWLRADLTAQRRRAEGEGDAREKALQALGGWRTEPDLAGVRDKEALEMLPAGEREAWLKLWGDVDALLKKAAGPDKP